MGTSFRVFWWICGLDGCGFARCINPGGTASLYGVFPNRGCQRPVREIWEADIVVVQRHFLDLDLSLIEDLKKAGKKIVVDMDDHLLGIPPRNPAHRIYTPALKRNLIRLLNMADMLTVSTEPLANELRRYNPRIAVLPNSVNPEMVDADGPACRTRTDGRVRIGWVGSKTHDEDLEAVVQVLLDLLAERDDIELLFMGGYPDAVVDTLAEQGVVIERQGPSLDQDPGGVEFAEADRFVETAPVAKRIYLVKFVPVFHYHQILTELGIHIGIAPLVDNTFNRCKSNIKYLEYTLAGVPTVASNVYPYSNTITNGNGIIVKRNRYDLWRRALLDLIKNEERRVALFEEAKKQICREYDIRRNVLLWRQAYENLMEGRL